MLNGKGNRVPLLKAWHAGYDEALAEANGAPTAQELQERVAKAEAAGKVAFAAGVVSTPALDPNLSPLISGCQPGQGVKVIEAWTRGWHNANLGIDPERQRKLDLIWRKVGAEYRGLSTDGKRSIMRWAKYGGGLIDLDALPDAEVEDMASFYAR